MVNIIILLPEYYIMDNNIIIEPALIGVHNPIFKELPEKYKKVNFELIKVGDTIRLFDNCVVQFVVDTTNAYDTCQKIKEMYYHQFSMSDDTKWYTGPDGGTITGIVYNLIGSHFDTNTRKNMVDKYENNEKISFADLFGDAHNFEGFQQVRNNLWQVRRTN